MTSHAFTKKAAEAVRRLSRKDMPEGSWLAGVGGPHHEVMGVSDVEVELCGAKLGILVTGKRDVELRTLKPQYNLSRRSYDCRKQDTYRDQEDSPSEGARRG